MSSSLTLCLTGPQNARKIVQIDSTCSTEELYSKANEVFGVNIQSLLVGFPPKIIGKSEEVSLSQVNIQNQEKIHVVTGTSGTNTFPTAENSTSGSTQTHEQTRAKRKASEKAKNSFAAIIQTQDAILRQDATKTSSSNKKVPNRSITSSKRHSKPSFPTATVGRRLQDGAVVSPKKRSKSNSNAHNGSGDVSLALLGALSDKSSTGRLMRQGWRQAVSNAYEQNQAAARLAAIPHSVKFTVENDKIRVNFAKGVQGRGEYEETVDYLPHDVLETVIMSIHPANPEALRPENLALLSPRVLWSLVYHIRDVHIEEALQAMGPQLDWSFLQRRQRQLSSKARENLRQQQPVTEQDEDLEAAAAAIESVDRAMESLSSYEHSQQRSRILDAVETRLKWNIITPDELDEDELQLCLREAPLDEPSLGVLVNCLTQQCSIHNWRELANANAHEIANILGVDIENVEIWIDKAQQESLEEIIVEICDHNVEAVEILREAARSGTPKDLAAWHAIPDTLYDVLSSNYSGSCALPTIEDLRRWSARSRQGLAQFEWLSFYTTPLTSL